MRYISDDGKVFNTEQECCEYEQKVERDKVKKEELKKQQEERYKSICEHHNELIEEISSYEKDYNSHVFSGLCYNGMLQLISDLNRTFG